MRTAENHLHNHTTVQTDKLKDLRERSFFRQHFILQQLQVFFPPTHKLFNKFFIFTGKLSIAVITL